MTSTQKAAGPEEISKRYLANPAQQGFLADPSMYRAAIAGIGGGKSEVGVFDLARHLLRYPGMEALLVAPTYRMLYRSSYRKFKEVLSWWGTDDGNEPVLIDQENKSQGWVQLTNGSRLWLGYAQEPDSLRAVEVSVAMMDEASYCPEKAFEVLQGRCRQPGFPHRVWICTTPRGRNWVYDRFVDREDGEDSFYSWHHWTTYDNPALTPEDLVAWEESYVPGSDWHAQEMLAQFVRFAGLVYSMFDPKLHVLSPQQLTPGRFKHVIAGVDWGVSSPGCIAVVGVDKADRIWWIDEVYERGTVTHGDPGNDWVTAARTLQSEWGIEVFFADPSDANAIKAWERAGLPVRRANNAVLDGIREVQSAISADRLRVWGERCPFTLSEIDQYHWREDRDGNPIEDAQPAKEFDHALDARRYAHMGLRTLGIHPLDQAAQDEQTPSVGIVNRGNAA